MVHRHAQGRMRMLAKSPRLHSGKHEEHAFDEQLPDDCAKLHLVVGDAGEGAACDRADWVNAGFREKK